jgi:hypothetical protein
MGIGRHRTVGRKDEKDRKDGGMDGSGKVRGNKGTAGETKGVGGG